jgi:hypothetical protein
MRQPRSPTTPFVSSFSRWPPRTIPARGVTRSVFAMSMAGSSSTTPRLVAPRYKRSSGSTVSFTRCSILDHYARTRGRRQSGCCAIRMILTPSHARRRSLIACLESSRSITSERTSAMTRQRRGAGPSPTTAIDPRPIAAPGLSLRSVLGRQRAIGQVELRESTEGAWRRARPRALARHPRDRRSRQISDRGPAVGHSDSSCLRTAAGLPTRSPVPLVVQSHRDRTSRDPARRTVATEPVAATEDRHRHRRPNALLRSARSRSGSRGDRRRHRRVHDGRAVLAASARDG